MRFDTNFLRKYGVSVEIPPGKQLAALEFKSQDGKIAGRATSPGGFKRLIKANGGCRIEPVFEALRRR